jgi:hypothetical protein
LPNYYKFKDNRKKSNKNQTVLNTEEKSNDTSIETDINNIFIEVDELKSFYYNKRKVTIRYLHYKIGENDYHLATNLFDKDKFPLETIKVLYHKRWSIEEYFKLVKEKMKMGRYTVLIKKNYL